MSCNALWKKRRQPNRRVSNGENRCNASGCFSYSRYFVGAFLIPYVLIMFFVGRSMFYMEMLMGQFRSAGATLVFDCVPIARGLLLRTAASLKIILAPFHFRIVWNDPNLSQTLVDHITGIGAPISVMSSLAETKGCTKRRDWNTLRLALSNGNKFRCIQTLTEGMKRTELPI